MSHTDERMQKIKAGMAFNPPPDDHIKWMAVKEDMQWLIEQVENLPSAKGHQEPHQAHRRFVFFRREDPTGKSGTGIVLEGVEYSDGVVQVHWVVGNARGSTHYNNAGDAIDIHGHGGATQLVWLDGPDERFETDGWTVVWDA